MEQLVKNVDSDKVPESETVYVKFSELEGALSQAITSIRALGLAPEEKKDRPPEASLIEVPSDLAQKVADRIRNAAEMGDITELKKISDESKSESKVLAPFCEMILRSVEDFDFDKIVQMARDFENIGKKSD